MESMDYLPVNYFDSKKMFQSGMHAFSLGDRNQYFFPKEVADKLVNFGL